MNKRWAKAVFAGALAVATQVSAGFIDVTGGYNVLTFGDFTSQNDQIHGKLAAGGNVSIQDGFGVNVDEKDITTPETNKLKAIVSGGNVTLTNNGQVHGSVCAAKNVTVNNATVTGDVYGENITMTNWDIRGTSYYTKSANVPYKQTKKIDELPVPVDFAAQQAAALELSAKLAEHGSNDYDIISKTLYIKDVSDDDINFITIDAKDLAGVSSLHFENMEKQYVINVDGNGGAIALADIDKQNYNTGVDFNFSNVLFNFTNAKSLAIKSFYGNILAADIDVTGNDGQMHGSFVAKSFSGKIQFHQVVPSDFNPPPEPPTNVPESSTVTMLIAGALAIFFSRKNVFVRK